MIMQSAVFALRICSDAHTCFLDNTSVMLYLSLCLCLRVCATGCRFARVALVHGCALGCGGMHVRPVIRICGDARTCLQLHARLGLAASVVCYACGCTNGFVLILFARVNSGSRESAFATCVTAR